MKISSNDGLKSYAQLIYLIKAATGNLDARKEEIMNIYWEKLMMKVPTWLKPTTFHQALRSNHPVDPQHRAGPPPSAVLRLLEEFKRSGGEVNSLAHETLLGRMSAGLEGTSSTTYYSHINMLQWACSVFECSVCPASLCDIRRVALVCNNPSILRG